MSTTSKPLRLLAILQQRGISNTAFARSIGVPRSTLITWLHGHSKPLHDHHVQLEVALVELGIEPRIALVSEGEPIVLPPSTTKPRVLTSRRPRPATPPQPPPEDDDMTLTREYLNLREIEGFGLIDDPFDDAEALSEGFLTPEAQSVLRMMSRAVMNRQILAITAEPGAGKSTLLRLLAARSAPEATIRLIMPATLDRGAMTANTFAVAVLRELTGRDTSGLSSEGRAELLTSTLAAARRDGLVPALVIDEAHCLSNAALLAIKQLWDRNDLYRGLAVILAGQPPLATALRKDATLRELAARTRLVELPGLERYVGDYLRWRFKRIGADANAVFAPETYATLGRMAILPLAINNLAARAMKVAFSVGDRVVQPAHVGRPANRGMEAA